MMITYGGIVPDVTVVVFESVVLPVLADAVESLDADEGISTT
jgi:hypothetical protein